MRRAIFIPLCLAFSVSAAPKDGLIIKTQQGLVEGTLISSGVRQFLGIPYATANRWEAPRPPPFRNTTFNATGFGDSCVQNTGPDNVQFYRLSGLAKDSIIVPEAEECLSINIWTPSISRKQKTAVMIWVYGGGLQFGTSNFVLYNGRHMVQDNEDFLLVSFNYRLNIFGLPNAPQLLDPNQSQNFGLLDIETAVNWVHDNIAEFGGDPDRIVLFGESAGGVAVDAYSYAHSNDTIVKGIIEQSGTLSNVGVSDVIDPSCWNNVAKAVGCGNATTDAQLSCMKAVPFRKLEDAVISTNTIFLPVGDNITFFTNISARSTTGNFLQVPLLVGSTQHEADIFVVALEENILGFPVPVITEQLSDIMTQLQFTCPAGYTAEDRIKANVPTWRYQYQAVFPDISSHPDLRSYHSSEIPIVFGTYEEGFSGSPTKDEITFSRYVQQAWVAFARDPTHGLSNYGWPMYNSTTASLVQLGNPANKTGATFGQGQFTDLSCGAFEALAQLNDQLLGLLTGLSKPKEA
ncbi:carboxylesterase [Collybia nuda]|uniref:Carboxylic ester hydrolase n=1 Tax=Collybia nuda TaxID=64659 RepID=A0A9P5Y7H6_9AGAR|nr:carboxylesterase [Collybia nuda]